MSIQLWFVTNAAKAKGQDFRRFDEDFPTVTAALLQLAMLADAAPGEYQISDSKGDILHIETDSSGNIAKVRRGTRLKKPKGAQRPAQFCQERPRPVAVSA